MLNLIWFALLGGGLAYAALNGRVEAASNALFAAGAQAVEVLLQLAGVVAIWFGVSRIAERAGLIDVLARVLAPGLRRLFPEVPDNHPAVGAIVMNLAANLLGLSNAATPFGLKAMRELQTLNPEPEAASPTMITFLAINSACVTLIPATTVALRAAAGARQPADIVIPAALSTGVALIVALAVNAIFRRRFGTRDAP